MDLTQRSTLAKYGEQETRSRLWDFIPNAFGRVQTGDMTYLDQLTVNHTCQVSPVVKEETDTSCGRFIP